MKALSKSRLNRKLNAKVIDELQAEVERILDEERAKIAYEAVQYAAPELMAQAIAVMLLAMSKRGYGKRRLNYFYDWYVSLMNMPSDMLGKTPSTFDAVKYVQENYGIDFDRVKPKFKEFREWYRS